MQKLKTNYSKIGICKTKLRDKNNCEQIFIETFLYQRIDCCNKAFMNLYVIFLTFFVMTIHYFHLHKFYTNSISSSSQHSFKNEF